MMATSVPHLKPSSEVTLPTVATTGSSSSSSASSASSPSSSTSASSASSALSPSSASSSSPSFSASSSSSSSSSTTTKTTRIVFKMRAEAFDSTPTQHNVCNPQDHKEYKQQQHKQQQQPHSTLMQPLLVLNKHILLTAVALVVCLFLRSTSASPVFVDNPSLAQFQSGRNIRRLPCIVRKSGRSGVCMFAIDCMKQNGTHLGTCIDRFYFGSCCQMQEDTPHYAPEISDNSIDQNTISHFVHESTTLPTSALFKVRESTTESPHQAASANTTKNITSTVSTRTTTVSSSVSRSPPTPTTTTTTTSKSSSSLRPTAITAPHKHSQFVVRTTFRPRPQIAGKPTIEPTTIKPPKRKTTIWPLLLTTTAPTTLPPPEDRVEFTTLPQKFYTFQVVETTTGSATEPPNNSDDVPTLITTQRPPRPTSASLVTTTTVRPTTGKPKPSPSSFRPAPSRKPIQTKRPAGKPTLKPESTKPGLVNKTTTAPGRRPAPELDETLTASNTIEVKTTLTPAFTTSTTKASRPKPKPTAEIVKVPRPTVGVTDTTARPAPTTTTTTTTTTTIKTSTASTSTLKEEGPKQPETSTQTQVQSISTAGPTSLSTSLLTSTSRPTPPEHSTPKKPSVATTTPATITTTEKPIIAVSSTTIASTTTATTTTMRTTPTLATTEASKVNDFILPTTQKPGLVTWTNVDGEPLPNSTTDEDWQPRPPSEGWVPLVTIAPETHVNKTTTASITEAPESSSTQKIIVSITSSVSEITNNSSISSIPEHITNITDIPKPTIISTTITTTTTSTTHPPTSTTTILTTESPTDVSVSTTAESTLSTASTASTTQIPGNVSSSTSVVVDVTTEDLSGSLNSTTAAPVNTLEGVDYRQVCGRRMFPEPRIVGGSNAAFGRWPWQISLRQWRTSTYLHKCGAALLNENWAITAAHCVDNVPPSDLLLRLGEYDLAEEEEPYGYQERRVQIVASHPQFDPRTFEYDLALLRFYEPVIFQPNIIPVCVPDNDFDFIGQTAFVTGWGRLYEDGPLPSVLQEVAVPVINNSICETMYRAAGYIEHIPHIFICAGWKKGGYDSCEGDSGGPMVLQREEDKRFQLGGVISWGIGCAEANQPGVYTRISEFRDWINQILQF